VKTDLPKSWVRTRRRDYYYRRAKKEQYRSRAAYKLIQAVNRFGFIKQGYAVVDLGAAPGGWIQASREIVGERGFVLGLDQKTIEPTGHSNVCTIVGDLRDSGIASRINAILPRKADVVISDVSPSVSGVWELDHARQIDLARRSLEIARGILAADGNFFVKIFQGDLLDSFVSEVKEDFSITRLVKPKASRSASAEIYLLGLSYQGKQ
jgi:23S rRNA (uridine2552-2'-O)-methyltransferase